MSSPENERYGKNGPTVVEKAARWIVGSAALIILFEVAYQGYLGHELQGFAGNIAGGVNYILGFLTGTYRFLHGDLQVRDGAGLVEIFQAVSRTQPDWHLNPAVGQPIGNLAERVFRPFSELSR